MMVNVEKVVYMLYQNNMLKYGKKKCCNGAVLVLKWLQGGVGYGIEAF